jgi:hypothetical protein
MVTKKLQQIATGGGTFDPDEGPINFVAVSSNDQTLALTHATHVLIALNELTGDADFRRFEALLDSGKHKVFLDSGIFAINAAYRREHPEVPETFVIPPHEMPGFQELRDVYVEVIRKYESRLWGYVELDQGGEPWKPKTRAALEKEGLRPIPVYHPMVDSREYFDKLASTYDRICVGTPKLQFVRKRLYTTVWHRWKKYPGLRWIHVLGCVPNQWSRAIPFSSYDSSTWTEPMRWGVFHEQADGKMFTQLPKNFMYRYEADPDSADGSNKATSVAMSQAFMVQKNLRHRIDLMRDVKLPIQPGARVEA